MEGITSRHLNFSLFLSDLYPVSIDFKPILVPHELYTVVFFRNIVFCDLPFDRFNLILTENQLAALERAKEEKEAHGEIETEYPGYLEAQDTY